MLLLADDDGVDGVNVCAQKASLVLVALTLKKVFGFGEFASQGRLAASGTKAYNTYTSGVYLYLFNTVDQVLIKVYNRI